MEGPPLRPRPAARRHLLPRLGAEGPARRVQARSLRDVRRLDERSADDVRGTVAQAADRDWTPARGPKPIGDRPDRRAAEKAGADDGVETGRRRSRIERQSAAAAQARAGLRAAQ